MRDDAILDEGGRHQRVSLRHLCDVGYFGELQDPMLDARTYVYPWEYHI